MKSFFSNFIKVLLTNLSWKVMAIIMAFGMWFFISNYTDPLRTETIPVTLMLLNEDEIENMHLENIIQLRTQTIGLQLRGTGSSIDAIRGNLAAYIDLSTTDIANAAQNAEHIRVNVQHMGISDDIELIAIRPPNVLLMMDSIVNLSFAVELDTQGEEPPDDYIITPGDIRISPSRITVRGPASTANTIQRLVATVGIEGHTQNIDAQNVPLRALDAAGNVVSSPHLFIDDSVDIYIQIFRRGRVNITAPQYLGQPSPGYGVLSFDWQPRYMDIAGESDEIYPLTSIALPPIPDEQMQGHTGTFNIPHNFNADLAELGSSLFLIDQTQNIINIEVNIEPYIEREFVIAIDDFGVIRIDEDHEVITEEVTLTLTGLESIMAAVNNIAANVNLTGAALPYGINYLPIDFVLPNRVSIVGDAPMLMVYVSPEEPEEAEEEDYNDYANDNDAFEEGDNN